MPSVLIIGGGGREHALALALARAPSGPRVMVAPGNPGMVAPIERVALAGTDPAHYVDFAVRNDVDLVVVGPEAPLVDGVADALRNRGIAVLGPNRAAAELEGSKQFAKVVMEEALVPTARWSAFDAVEAAVSYARGLAGGAVVKADGLAGGKGVIVAEDADAAEDAVRTIMGGRHGDAGRRVIVEERLVGEEVSVIALSDGRRVALLPSSQDHKRVGEGDRGPNTGGMGAYSPAPVADAELLEMAKSRCLQPVVDTMAERGTPFVGVLYAGLMVTADGPKVLEYNVRFGDPEAQVILPLIGDDVFQLFSACAKGALPEGPVLRSQSAAVTVVLCAEGYPASPRKGDVIRGLDGAAKLEGVAIIHAGTARTGEHFTTNGGRVLDVVAEAPTLAAAVKRAYEAVELISWNGMHYRRDIAHRALGRLGES